MGKQVSQHQMNSVNKEAQFLSKLGGSNQNFIKCYYSFFDTEKVNVKYLNL